MSRDIRIKRIREFPINEGVLSSIGSAVGSMLSGKKSKLNGILKKLKVAREKDVEHTVKIEKEIFKISNEATPEARFKMSNLERQKRTYSSIKNQEIDSLMKSSEKMIQDNPKLSAFFYSELAEIQEETTDVMIKSLRPYKKKTDLEEIAKEFKDLISETQTKKSFYLDTRSNEYVSQDFSKVPENINREIISFVDLSNKDASSALKGFDDNKLEYYKSELESWRFHLEIEYDKSLSSLKKDIKKAKESNNDWAISSLEKEEANLRYTLKKPIDKIRSKNSLIEDEIKFRIS